MPSDDLTCPRGLTILSRLPRRNPDGSANIALHHSTVLVDFQSGRAGNRPRGHLSVSVPYQTRESRLSARVVIESPLPYRRPEKVSRRQTLASRKLILARGALPQRHGRLLPKATFSPPLPRDIIICVQPNADLASGGASSKDKDHWHVTHGKARGGASLLRAGGHTSVDEAWVNCGKGRTGIGRAFSMDLGRFGRLRMRVVSNHARAALCARRSALFLFLRQIQDGPIQRRSEGVDC